MRDASELAEEFDEIDEKVDMGVVGGVEKAS